MSCERSAIDPGLHAHVEPGLSASLTLGRAAASRRAEAARLDLASFGRDPGHCRSLLNG